jgi:hypothetical protein
MGKTRAGAWA